MMVTNENSGKPSSSGRFNEAEYRVKPNNLNQLTPNAVRLRVLLLTSLTVSKVTNSRICGTRRQCTKKTKPEKQRGISVIYKNKDRKSVV